MPLANGAGATPRSTKLVHLLLALATWKVYDTAPQPRGIVCFITVRISQRKRISKDALICARPATTSGYRLLTEGHQPKSQRIFQDVQQPVCNRHVSRSLRTSEYTASVHFQSLPNGAGRQICSLAGMRLDSEGVTVSNGRSLPFLPESTGLGALSQLEICSL